jgi:uncharacterized RDD family membrane protein YckC
MKCPKCGYLEFEAGDSCLNCGYEFSLSSSSADIPDLPIEREVEQARPAPDLDRLIGVPEPADAAADLPLFPPSHSAVVETSERRESTRRAVHRGGGRRADAVEDAPLISASARPRAPLGVRRATPEVPRARPRTSKPAVPSDTLFESEPSAIMRPAYHAQKGGDAGADALAAPSRRITAALVDASLLSALDAVVLYFTLRLCGLAATEILQLPLIPLAAFLFLLNGGYFIAFTAVGGQSIGKMALGIRVIAQEDGSVPIGRATIRTLAYVISALPLGAGFITGLLSADRLALHDRLAHTRVVQPSSPL